MAIARRDFLKVSLAAAAAPVALSARSSAGQPKPEPGADKLTAYQDGSQIWVRWNNYPVTGYRAHPTQKFPYLYPLSGPASGVSLTSESSAPYPHHRSMYFACDRVNGGNYWAGSASPPRIVSVGLKLGQVTPDSVEILDQCEWRDKDGKVAMKDERRFLVKLVGAALRTIDVDITWSAVQDVEVQKTNHSLFSIRAAHDLTPWGGGMLSSSEGKNGEKETFGRPAGWCTFYGKRPGVPGNGLEGVALFDHPRNPWKDCPWFTRDYGFISPSPFNYLDKPWTLKAGKSVKLDYCAVLYVGSPREASLQELYQAWVQD